MEKAHLRQLLIYINGSLLNGEMIIKFTNIRNRQILIENVLHSLIFIGKGRRKSPKEDSTVKTACDIEACSHDNDGDNAEKHSLIDQPVATTESCDKPSDSHNEDNSTEAAKLLNPGEEKSCDYHHSNQTKVAKRTECVTMDTLNNGKKPVMHGPIELTSESDPWFDTVISFQGYCRTSVTHVETAESTVNPQPSEAFEVMSDV